MNKPEWMPFYVSRFLSSANVMMMSHEGVGAYALLLCVAWHSGPPGTLPDDDKALAILCRMRPAQWKRVKTEVMRPFKLVGDRWHQEVMEKIASKSYGMLAQRREAGRASAVQRSLSNRSNASSMARVGVGSSSCPEEIPETPTTPTPLVQRPLNERSTSVQLSPKQIACYELLSSRPKWLPMRHAWLDVVTARDLAAMPTTTLSFLQWSIEDLRKRHQSMTNPAGVFVKHVRRADVGLIVGIAKAEREVQERKRMGEEEIA